MVRARVTKGNLLVPQAAEATGGHLVVGGTGALELVVVTGVRHTRTPGRDALVITVCTVLAWTLCVLAAPGTNAHLCNTHTHTHTGFNT